MTWVRLRERLPHSQPTSFPSRVGVQTWFSNYYTMLTKDELQFRAHFMTVVVRVSKNSPFLTAIMPVQCDPMILFQVLQDLFHIGP